MIVKNHLHISGADLPDLSAMESGTFLKSSAGARHGAFGIGFDWVFILPVVPHLIYFLKGGIPFFYVKRIAVVFCQGNIRIQAVFEASENIIDGKSPFIDVGVHSDFVRSAAFS
ncbi:MAG: hypothetical protein HFI35_11970 [Roseburia sp.]|nr:hypothetical protein [Roseburia sp.]